MNAKYFIKTLFMLVFALVLTGAIHAQDADIPLPDARGRDAQVTVNAATGTQRVITQRVIVGLNVAAPAQGTPDSAAVDGAAINGAQSALLAELSGVQVTDVTPFEYIPFMALTVDAAGLSVLQSSAYISHIEPDRASLPMLSTAASIVGASGPDGAWSYEYDGRGQVVAVLDTGIDKYHPALSGQIISEACFSTNGVLYDRDGQPSNAFSLCPNGAFSSMAPGSGLNCPTWIANCDHGTLISGTIASTHATYRGIAPAAKVIAVQVFTRVEGNLCAVDWGFYSPCVISLTSDQIRAMEYIYSLRDTYNLSAVTLSLGADFWSSEAQCDNDNFARKAIIDLLRNAGVATFAPTGNTGLSDQMLAPACISSVIAVGATNDADNVAAFSNTTTFMDFFAPGKNIHAPIPGGGFQDKSGTSMSTPVVVGAWLLLKQANRKLSIDALYQALAATGQPIAHDGTFSPRINVRAALPKVAVLPFAPARDAAISSHPITFQWSAASSAASDVYQYRFLLKNTRTGERITLYMAPTICTAQTCSYTHSTALLNHDRYFWKVVAIRNTGINFKSRKRFFTTAYPDVAQLLQPVSGDVLASPADLTTFEWSSLLGLIRYKLVLLDVTTGVRLLKTTILPPCAATCTYTVPDEVRAALLDGHTYRWRIIAYYHDGGVRSENRLFTTAFSP